MTLPSQNSSLHSELRDFLSRWASRYYPEYECQQRLVERTILVATNDPSVLDEDDISHTMIAILHRLAVADLQKSNVRNAASHDRQMRARRPDDVGPVGRSAGPASYTSSLAGRRCLVVEDEYHVAAGLLDVLEAAGAKVFGPVSNVRRAVEVLAEPSFALDVAVLDINLNGQLVYPAAALLAERGTPFVFVTGCGDMPMPDEFAQAPCLMKPCDNTTLLKTLSSIVTQASV